MPAVLIRSITRSDSHRLICLNRENRSYHRPWVHPFTEETGFEDWFSGLVTGGSVGLIAEDSASGGIVGVLTFSQIFLKDFRNAYLGFYGMQAFARRGLMSEAVRLATLYAFSEIGLHRVEANVQPGNQSSLALLTRLGFRKEGFSPRYLMIDGRWRDHERWALLADDGAADEGALQDSRTA